MSLPRKAGCSVRPTSVSNQMSGSFKLTMAMSSQVTSISNNTFSTVDTADGGGTAFPVLLERKYSFIFPP
jgi:hypothetical protein